MRIIRILLTLAMVIFICSCILKSVGSRANTFTYYNETTSHLTTKADTIKELRRVIEINDEECAKEFGSDESGVEIMITSKRITHSQFDPVLGTRSDSCDWCDIRELYLKKADLDPKVLYGFYMKCPGMRYNFGIPFSQKETVEKFHALSLKMIELSNCE
ncbi:hypothetical protein ACFL2S_11825 [Thermodesulfobacteriota bacterium]